MNHRISRRGFLKLALTTAGAAGAAALIQKPFLLYALPQQGNWTIINPANSPTARDGHVIATLPDGTAIVMGGEDDSLNLSNDLYSYSNGNWNYLTPTTPDKPSARRNSASWIANNKLYIHGGWDPDKKALDDVWTFDPTSKQWSQVSISGDKPTARFGHRATPLANGAVVLSGGLPSEGGTTLKDLWDFYPINAFGFVSVCPIGMAHHVAQVVGNTLFLLYQEKVVTFDFTNYIWNVGNGGPPLDGHAASALSRNDLNEYIITIFGGKKYDGTASNVVYDFNTKTNVLTQQQELMPFPLITGSCANLHEGQGGSGSAALRAPQAGTGIEVLFFGGSDGTKKLATTLLYSTVHRDRTYLPIVLR